MNTSLPKKQGLYDPWFEHDACGVGVVANIKGKKSNKILRQALVVLHNICLLYTSPSPRDCS